MTRWSPPIETLIQTIGEQSECYAILHRNAEKYYSYLQHFFAIPAIVLSTIAGTGSFAFGSDTAEGDKTPSSIIGAISIAVGVIQTLSTYFRFAQLAELHRVSAISYQKMYNRISGELVLERTDRKDADQFLETLRNDIERLEEITPAIPDRVIMAFKKKYSGNTDVRRPTIANGLEKVMVNVDVPAPPPPTPEPLPELELPPPAVQSPAARPRNWR